VIAVAAAATFYYSHAVGLVAGCVGELVRKAILRVLKLPERDRQGPSPAL
jgi:hypothetical protein